MLKPNLKVLDCTIRDGGLINNHDFTPELVRDVFQALSAAGVDYVELGYRNSKKRFSIDEYGPWKFCEEDTLQKVVEGVARPAKVSVMVDLDRVDPKEIPEAGNSCVDLVRVAAYAKDILAALELVDTFIGKGYETSLNLMAVSRDQGPLMDEALAKTAERSSVSAVYIVDSFGSCYPENIRELVGHFQKAVPGRAIGFHGHNHQQLALGNTIEAIQAGADWVDGTVYGIGRAAGNCPLELLLGYLNESRFDIRPVLDVIASRFVHLKEKIEWGYRIPFALTGLLNQHPRSAMALRKSDRKEEYRAFYDQLASEKPKPKD